MRRLDRNRKRPGKLAVNGSLLAYLNPQSAIAGQFRTIRNNIRYAAGGKSARSVVITSPGEGEGKTTAAVNLAVSTAMRGDKVLLVDAHVRKPFLHYVFNPSTSAGLTSVLADQSELEQAIFHTEIGRLHVLQGGPPLANAMELLDSQAMNELMAFVTEQYDLVIFDGAPVLGGPDTSALASRCDGVVMLLSSGRTTMDKAAEAKRSLEFAGARIVGAVLNR